MMVEGKGRVAPAPIIVRISMADWIALGDEANRRAERRGYASGRTAWARGLASSGTEFPVVGVLPPARAAILKGLLGEHAACVWSREASVDLAERRFGDGGVDLRMGNVPVQVKTRMRPPSLVRTTEADAQRYRAYVFCAWDGADCIALLGWSHRAEVVKCAKVLGKGGAHHNYAVEDAALLPMPRLRTFCEARR